MILKKPTWLHKPISVDNLEAIQEEMLPILYREIPNFDTAEPTFCFVLRPKIEKFAPLYTKFLESFGLLNRWYYSAFVTTNGDHKFSIHVDSLEWKTRSYGLNLPLINCDGTYTVFYDAEIETKPEYDANNPVNSARLIKKDTTGTEIFRFPASQPAWVNTTIPHAPVSTHTKPRAIISARFNPEVHELFNK